MHIRRVLTQGRLLIGMASLTVIFLLTIGSAAQALHVVASTAWTAAIAEAAGASRVTVLAPLELRHPPERDFRPSDITTAIKADALVWAGYEAFIGQLISAADIADDKVYHITTQNTPEHLVQETRRLAALWGTETKQATWEAAFIPVTDAIKSSAERADVRNKRAIVTGHLAAFAGWLGYDIVDTFGFEDMTPARLHRLAQLQPDIIIDVWHNPTAEAVAIAANAPYVLLINFPGRDGTRTLIDVFSHNAAQLGLNLQ